MKFWDTSALVPLILAEPKSAEMRAIYGEDPTIVTSAFTAVEVGSAVWRRRHAHQISVDAHQDADVLFASLTTTWIEYPVVQDAIDAAIGVMSRHPLRAGDALQLGTALVAAGAARKPYFVTLDEDLGLAARSEGFPVLP
ncbi:MAG TPA: type II toxin-antitoxin system VapC family toxin [Thermoanaerobaculia bacterium]|jgi:predicted nucleic acid-binding protein